VIVYQVTGEEVQILAVRYGAQLYPPSIASSDNDKP
jgi:hypothetical protein